MAFAANYVPKAGVGTLIAMMLPFCTSFLLLGACFFVWTFFAGLLVGPAAPSFYAAG